jgi:3,4-dihydroxy 2-butanone 4-phosphate synthase / GTP cyclohydrolase II
MSEDPTVTDPAARDPEAAADPGREADEAAGGFSSVESALEDFRRGRMVVVCDDENRENEGDLTLPAQFAPPEAINFLAKEARGLICLALTPMRCDELGLDLMAAKNESPFQTAFTVSIEAREGVTTGISAADRAHTVQVAIDPHTNPGDLVQPGHVFPLKAKEGGVLERAGQTEAAVDLARLAGLIPGGVICEVMNEDGTMARVPDLIPYCRRHGLKLITVADLIAYRRRTERLVERVVATRLPTAFGEFSAVGYRSLVDDKHHLAMVKGDVRGKADVLVRVHSECLTGDVFHSLRCDCGEQLDAALAMIEREGEGVLLYLSQEGRGIGLLNKLRAYKLQEDGFDTVEANLKLGLPADLRDYGIGAQILVDLGLSSIRILTNNPKKIHGLEGYGLSVADQIPIQAVPNPHNETYLRVKREKLGHALHHQGLPLDEELLHAEHQKDVEREALGAVGGDTEGGLPSDPAGTGGGAGGSGDPAGSGSGAEEEEEDAGT